jgi:hypothetical protein
MSKSKLFKSCLREGLLFFCGLLLAGSSALSSWRILAVSQSQSKTISRGIVIRKIEDDPVRITNMKVGPNLRRFEEQFSDSDDWLKKLSIEIENHWKKPIVYLMVSLDFPETRSSGDEMRFYVYSGNEPGRLPLKRENINIAAGDKLVLNLADNYEWLTQFLQIRHAMNQINKVEIKVTRAVFDDKTAWGEGEFFMQDPNNPKRYINLGTKPPNP